MMLSVHDHDTADIAQCGFAIGKQSVPPAQIVETSQARLRSVTCGDPHVRAVTFAGDQKVTQSRNTGYGVTWPASSLIESIKKSEHRLGSR
jgi:hypothetical protein